MEVGLLRISPPLEDDVDVKIRKAEEELARLRKERALIELQHQLAEEQRFLANAHENATSVPHVPHAAHVAPPKATNFLGPYPVVAFDADSAEQRFKRSSSELTLGVDDAISPFPEYTPMLPVAKVYHGINRKEFLLLMRRLEGHFEEEDQYYVTDHRKISEACRHLSEGIRVKWALVQLSPDGRTSWPDFCVWLSSNIRNFVNPDVAERRYRGARQRREQPVSRFAALLGSLEANLPRLLSDDERRQRLWDGVLPEIRAAAPYGFPTSYQVGITQLCAAARSLIGGGRPRRRRRRGGGRARARVL
ncbi:hypothetical protein BDW59DRAFT_92599 [Aspergillus cavernicola]|uniref:Uncharacterized protein n=1 Tax=Aspergillus cavernicola TaxID=176166 RepID=A0ABR4I7Z7_9EURO